MESKKGSKQTYAKKVRVNPQAWFTDVAHKRVPLLIRGSNGYYLRFQVTDPVSGEQYTNNAGWSGVLRAFFVATEAEARSDDWCKFRFAQGGLFQDGYQMYVMDCMGMPGVWIYWEWVAGYPRLTVRSSASDSLKSANRVMFRPQWRGMEEVLYLSDGRVSWKVPGMMVEFTNPPPQWGKHSQLIRMEHGLEWYGVNAPLTLNELLIYRACDAYVDYKACIREFTELTSATFSGLQFTSVNPLDYGTWIQKSENKYQCVMNEQSGRLVTPLGILMNCTDPANNINWWTSKKDQDKFMTEYCSDKANEDKKACQCFRLNKRIEADPVISKLGIQVACRAQCQEAGVYRLQTWIDSLNAGNCANQCIQVQNITDINQQALIQDLNQTCTVKQAPPESEPSAPPPSNPPTNPPADDDVKPPPAGGSGWPTWPSSGDPPKPPPSTSTGGLTQNQLLMIGGGALVVVALLWVSLRGNRRRNDYYYD